MDWIKRLVYLFCFYQWTSCTEPPCVFDLQCAECIPDNMPLVTSHRAANGSVVVPSGDEVTLSCGAGRLLAYSARGTLSARCESGRLRVAADGALRTLLELGCQENIFEDVLHSVEHCAPPLQGRAYQLQEPGRGTRHLATLCYNADRGLAAFARTAQPLRLAPHADRAAPLTLLGNFNHMFDANTRHAADKLYSDDTRTNRRLQELFKHEKVSFAGQTITSIQLLSGTYFDDQNMRVADFVSNAVAAWGSVASGNLAHLHKDVAKLIRMARPHTQLEVYSGTHGVAALRTEHSHREIYLGIERFPVPKYIWAVVHDKTAERALAVVVLNDPFVAVSEVRDAVFCDSVCGRAVWLHALRRHRNYETPLYGLTFCCGVHNFTDFVTEMPKAAVANVSEGHDGLLINLFT